MIVTVSSAFTTFLLGGAAGVVGTSMVVMLVRRKQKVRVPQHAISPVYEDVTKAVVTVSPNMAYEDVFKLTLL